MSFWLSLPVTDERPESLALSLPPGQAARLADALRQLGLPPTLSAPRAVLHEATILAIDELGEVLSRLSTHLLRGGDSAGELREAIAELSGLLDLLESLTRAGGDGS